jgi:PKD repeat protein/N-acetylneuraminic acid mutarotase
LAVFLSTAHGQTVLHRINAGGPDHLDTEGQLWLSDEHYNTGSVYWTGSPIAGADGNQWIYQTERWDPPSDPELQYALPVAVTPATYRVRLHFADIYEGTHQVGGRIFGVEMEGETVLGGLDIFAQVGGFAALVVETDVAVGDGVLDILFRHETENPKISAIEVILLPPNEPPVAVATVAHLEGGSTASFQFSGGSSRDPEGGPLQYLWSFGDGGGSTLVDPVHLYLEPGSYPVTLTVTDRLGLADNATLTVVFNPENQFPVAAASADPVRGDLSLIVRFDGSASTDPEGSELDYRWDFGDGSIGAGAAPSHTYHQVGTYRATLTVTDQGLLSSTSSVDIAVTPLHRRGAALHRINAGGPEYLDSLGQTWSADHSYSTGSAYGTASPIAGTGDPALYQTERWDPDDGFELEYALVVASAPALYQVHLHFADIYGPTQAAGQRVFDVAIEGVVAFSGVDIGSEVGGDAALVKTATVLVDDGILNVRLLHLIENPKISALEVVSYQSSGANLHVVIVAPSLVIDYDGDGSETVLLDGTDSHTHEPGRTLAGFEWSLLGVAFSAEAAVSRSLPVGGPHLLTLTITDDDAPADHLSDSVSIEVRSSSDVPGSLVLYYTGGSDLLSGPLGEPVFGEVVPRLEIGEGDGRIGGSPLTASALVRFLFQVDIAADGIHQFTLYGGANRTLTLDGSPASGPRALMAGRHSLEARFAVGSVRELPLLIALSEQGGPPGTVGPELLTHSQVELPPVINDAPTGGSPFGGEEVSIAGLGFFPPGGVSVHWAGELLTGDGLEVTPTTLRFAAPGGAAGVTVPVSVETPNGVSRQVDYTYLAGAVPISFEKSYLTDIPLPTSVEWGPDHRLYVGSVNGVIKVISFDHNYGITATQTVTAFSALPNSNIMGLAFDPFEPAGAEPRLYVSHGTIYANGGGCFTGTSTYSGQVSVVTGPEFDTVEPVVTGLPVSNHDHLVNGLQFDGHGDLLIAIGGNTNAGVEACAMGGLPESPLSAAVVRARLSRGLFNGSLVYRESITGNTNSDQVSGGAVDLDPGLRRSVSVYASGLRNPWDLVVTTSGRVYCTDNGPNTGFGPASLSAATEGSDPYSPDELVLLERGGYFGHPNRNRGRYDDRENVYRRSSDSPLGGDVHNPPLTTFPPSTNGIVEYRADAFNGALRGDLLLQKWNDQTYRVSLSSDGRQVALVEELPVSMGSLDVATGPGGVLFGGDFYGNGLYVAKPVDIGVGSGLAVYDVTPWRAPETGGHPFVIGGGGFGTQVTVSFGPAVAPLTEITPTKLYGIVPPGVSGSLVDVTVSSDGSAKTLTRAFQYLGPKEGHPLDARWIAGPDLPVPMGEVAMGLIGGTLYLVGAGASETLRYHTSTGQWDSLGTARPYLGDHHAAEVVGDRLYLFGGAGASAGKVQIYYPVFNAWTVATSMPWAALSSSSAVIDGLVYLAGGIVDGSTVDVHARYDPLSDTWTPLAPMPHGRNHAASGTDGSRFYVFGGRGSGSGDGNVVADGFDTLQIYDPVTDAWVSSLDPGSPLDPLPQARGGMGKAIYFQGEFYVMGGETVTGAGATSGGVYDRVDVYDPVGNSWRQQARMTVARHGIFPVLVGERCFVAGGGTVAGDTQSATLEIAAL